MRRRFRCNGFFGFTCLLLCEGYLLGISLLARDISRADVIGLINDCGQKGVRTLTSSICIYGSTNERVPTLFANRILAWNSI